MQSIALDLNTNFAKTAVFCEVRRRSEPNLIIIPLHEGGIFIPKIKERSSNVFGSVLGEYYGNNKGIFYDSRDYRRSAVGSYRNADKMTLIQGYLDIIELCHSDSYDPFLVDMELRCLEEIGILLRYNHNHDPHTGRFTSGSGVDNGGESGIIKLEDIEIGKSLSVKVKNYNIMDLQTGDTFHFSEGTKI